MHELVGGLIETVLAAAFTWGVEPPCQRHTLEPRTALHLHGSPLRADHAVDLTPVKPARSWSARSKVSTDPSFQKLIRCGLSACEFVRIEP